MIFLNGQKIDFVKFPNGETKVNGEQIYSLIQRHPINNIVFKYENDGDLPKLMFVKRFIDERNASCILTIAYMPYSRMDRIEGLSVFTLKYVSEFINSLNFDRIIVAEPHSDVTCALLNKATGENQTGWMLGEVEELVGFHKKIDYLFFPDAGAQKRYGNVAGYKQIVGYKHRDFDTGKIRSLEVVGLNESLKGSKVIIVDDLSSYGGTFMLSGQKLKELGADEVYLIVAHAEFSIFQGELLKPESPVNKVFATNSIIESNYYNDKLYEKLNVFRVF